MGALDPAGTTRWFAPSMRIELEDGIVSRTPALLRTARRLLVDSHGDLRDAAEPWRDRVNCVRRADTIDPASMLIRSDGFVAWAHDGPTRLTEALHVHAWSGAPTRATTSSTEKRIRERS